MQDFSGEALTEQNTEASLASLSYNSSRAATEWTAIFAFGVCAQRNGVERHETKRARSTENHSKIKTL